MVFTVEKNNQNESIEIYCDKEGIEVFLKELNKLAKNGGHTHFMTPSWAGDELTEEKQGKGTELVNHLVVVLKPENL